MSIYRLLIAFAALIVIFAATAKPSAADIISFPGFVIDGEGSFPAFDSCSFPGQYLMEVEIVLDDLEVDAEFEVDTAPKDFLFVFGSLEGTITSGGGTSSGYSLGGAGVVEPGETTGFIRYGGVGFWQSSDPVELSYWTSSQPGESRGISVSVDDIFIDEGDFTFVGDANGPGTIIYTFGVPEPGGLSLAGFAVFGLIISRRHRR